MSLKRSILFLFALVLALFLLFMMGQNAKKSYEKEKENIEIFAQEAKSLSTLKRKFGDKKAFSRAVSTLTRIAKPSKDYKKSDVRILLFENLAPSTLNNLLRKIENSTLLLKKLEITRQNSATASVRLEIKR